MITIILFIPSIINVDWVWNDSKLNTLLSKANLELEILDGYASQIPFIFNSTVRQNIAFDLNEEVNLNYNRYFKVVDICSLREDLSQSDLTSLSDWENNISEEFILVRILRVIVMLVGILLTIWSILVYIAFWFDRLNPFIAVDTLGILTIGKFHAAAEDKDSNFNLHNITRDKVVVGHRDVILISVIGLIFSSLVLTGKLFTMIASLVNFVLRFLGI